jgi:CheY-like chemotaxis protein
MTLPVIAISAYADKDKITQAISLGFDDYLTKPIDQDILQTLINHYV